MGADPLQTHVIHRQLTVTAGTPPAQMGKSEFGQIAAFAAAGVLALGVSYILRGIVKRRLSTKCAYPAVDVRYYDVDSLDYGFKTGGAAGGGVAGGGPRLYPERWLMLFIYSLNMATLSVLASTLPSSQLPAEHLYGVTAYPIVTLMSVLVFLSLPATIASSILFKRFGIRGTCCIALAVAVVGAWVIVAAAFTRSWYLQVAGTLVMGLGAPMVANACTGLSAKWFGVDERNLPTAMGSMIPGAVAGAVFNYVAVTKQALLASEFVIIAMMCTVAAGMFAMLYQERPPTAASAEEETTSYVSSWSSVTSMFQDSNFLILLFLFTLDGYGWGLILVTSIMSEIGYGQHDADLVMSIARWGSLSPLVVSPLADYLRVRDKRWPVWIMQGSQIASTLAQVGLTFALKPGMLPYICFCFFWVGVSTTAAAPILLELVTEVTYPHPEMLSAGVCLTVFGVSTFGFVQLSQIMKTAGTGGYLRFLWLQNVLFLVSLVLVVFFFKANLKRTDRAKARQAAGAPCAISHTPPITP